MDADERQAERFEEHRAHLRAVAYRMLGSLSEADDAVQEAWLRLSRSDADAVANLGGWLTTVVARVCLDMLRARRRGARSSWARGCPSRSSAPTTETDPAHQAELADSVGHRPARRPRDPDPRRAPRLRPARHVRRALRGGRPDRRPLARGARASSPAERAGGCAARRRRPIPDLDRQREVVAAFLAAARAGDFDALLEVLDPDVVFRVDGGRGPHARPPAVGAPAVARELLTRAPRFAPLARPAIVNGAAGLFLGPARRPAAVVGFTVVGGRIAAIDLVVDREKLREVLPD